MARKPKKPEPKRFEEIPEYVQVADELPHRNLFHNEVYKVIDTYNFCSKLYFIVEQKQQNGKVRQVMFCSDRFIEYKDSK